MKKVRYAIGALGVVPALGLVIPATNAAATVTHSPKNTGKSVQLGHVKTPLIDCVGNRRKAASSTYMAGAIFYSGVCVYQQSAVLHRAQGGLTERTRFYSGGGALERTTWQAGGAGSSQTNFISFPDINAHKVCQALVANSNHNKVKYGPICETT